jgi:hypothetical protein
MSEQPSEDDCDRLKIHEAIGVTALVAFVAVGLVISFVALAIRCVAVDAIDSLRKGRSHDVQ